MPNDNVSRDVLVGALEQATARESTRLNAIIVEASAVPVETARKPKARLRKHRGVFFDRGCYWIEYWGADGKRHREKAGTLGTAKKLVELRRSQTLEGKKLPALRSRPVTFGELAKAVPESKCNYRMAAILEKFGNSAAEEITPAEIKNWLEERTEWSLATKNRYIALMKLTFRLAEEAKRVRYNPARLVRQSKENNARIRWLTDAEETKLRAAIPSEHLSEFEIALHTGMRRSEQYGAAWGNLDEENGLLRISKSKHGEARYVRLNSRVRAVLAMLKPTPATGRIMTLKNPRGWFEKAVEVSGIAQFTWHDLRHTFISRLVMAGVDLRTVMELAGHKTIQMTMRYAHLAPSHVAAAVEKLVPTATSTATETRETQTAAARAVQ